MGRAAGILRSRGSGRWLVPTGVAIVAGLVLVSAAGCGQEVSSAGVAETTTRAEPTTTTTERIRPTTTTTTEPSSLGRIPETSVTPAGFESDPAVDGGFSGKGATVFDAAALLAEVDVRPEGEVSRYDRDAFGPWIDEDGDGCNTRHEVLRAESLVPAQMSTSGCKVVRGQWRSVYDGFTTDDPAQVEIDHLVALAEAWRSGADRWSPERRAAFRNDLGHPGALLAVSSSSNQSKADKDPAEWRPEDRGLWCRYATDWLTVKLRWGLTMDQAEHTATAEMLEGCGLPPTTTTTAPPPPPTTTTAPPVIQPQPVVPPTTVAPPPPASSCHPSYPTLCLPGSPDLNCADIPAKNFPVLPPDPHRLDGDKDGYGCES